MLRAPRNSMLVVLIGLSSLALSISTARAGDPTWRRFQASRAYSNSNGYYTNTVPVAPGPVTAGNGTYQSFSAESRAFAAPVLQLYYYLDAGYYHYYYAPPRAAAPPAPGALLPAPKQTVR
jgi:hypothetical protein